MKTVGPMPHDVLCIRFQPVEQLEPDEYMTTCVQVETVRDIWSYKLARTI